MTGSDGSAGHETIEQLRARIAELEAANATMAAAATAAEREALAPAAEAGGADSPRKRQPVRAAAVVVLLVVGSLLLPVAAVAGWGRTVLTDTDRFVATYAPLARDPQVQAYITDQVVTEIDNRVDIDQQVADLTGALTPLLQDRPRALVALTALQQPAADGVRSAMHRATTELVTSDAFVTIWEEALRRSHTQAIAALQGDPNAALVVTDEGLGIQLGPVIERVKAILLERGFSVVANVPAVDRTILLVRSSDFATVQSFYRLAVALGTWLPILALVMLAGAVLLARRRVTVLIIAALLIALAAVVLLGGLAVGKAVAFASVPSTVMPQGVLEVFYTTVTSSLGEVALAALTVGIVVALIAWFAGPYRTPRKLREASGGMAASLRRTGESHGLSTGRFGAWLTQYQTLVRVAVVVTAVLVLLFNRPLTPGFIVWTAIIALLAVIILGLLSRPDRVQPPVGVEQEGPVVSVRP